MGVPSSSNSNFNNNEPKPVAAVQEDNKITKQENNNSLHQSDSKVVCFDANGVWAKTQYRYAAYLFNAKTDISEWCDVQENGLLMFAANKYTHIVFLCFS